jgi:hypothetical protein
MLGPHANKLFNEMIDLLPDEQKKKDLLSAKEDKKAKEKGGYGKSSSSSQTSSSSNNDAKSKQEEKIIIPKAHKNVDPNSIVCKQCGKTILKADFEWHTASHYIEETVKPAPVTSSTSSASASSTAAPALSSAQPSKADQAPEFIDYPSLTMSTKVKQPKRKSSRPTYTAGAPTPHSTHSSSSKTTEIVANAYRFNPNLLPQTNSTVSVISIPPFAPSNFASFPLPRPASPPLTSGKSTSIATSTSASTAPINLPVSKATTTTTVTAAAAPFPLPSTNSTSSSSSASTSTSSASSLNADQKKKKVKGKVILHYG